MGQRTAAELEQGMGDILRSPRDEGPVRLIVRRTGPGQREILVTGQLDPTFGLVGDDWAKRPSRATGRPSPYAQVTLMNARFTELVAGDAAAGAWALAGDQLYVDLDLSQANLPAGSRLAIGSAVIEISAEPHTGCAQFSARFGTAALQAANSEPGRALRLRGANAVVVRAGVVRAGDLARKLVDGH